MAEKDLKKYSVYLAIPSKDNRCQHCRKNVAIAKVTTREGGLRVEESICGRCAQTYYPDEVASMLDTAIAGEAMQ